MERAINIRQFAEAIGYSPEWVSKLIKKGVIKPRQRPTGKRYFLWSDVEDWLNDRPSELFCNIKDCKNKEGSSNE